MSAMGHAEVRDLWNTLHAHQRLALWQSVIGLVSPSVSNHKIPTAGPCDAQKARLVLAHNDFLKAFNNHDTTLLKSVFAEDVTVHKGTCQWSSPPALECLGHDSACCGS